MAIQRNVVVQGLNNTFRATCISLSFCSAFSLSARGWTHTRPGHSNENYIHEEGLSMSPMSLFSSLIVSYFLVLTLNNCISVTPTGPKIFVCYKPLYNTVARTNIKVMKVTLESAILCEIYCNVHHSLTSNRVLT